MPNHIHHNYGPYVTNTLTTHIKLSPMDPAGGVQLLDEKKSWLVNQ